jgi:hypothetical protein
MEAFEVVAETIVDDAVCALSQHKKVVGDLLMEYDCSSG